MCKVIISSIYYALAGEAYFADDGLEQVLSGEKAQYLQDQIMAKETSRNLLRHGNSLLQEKVHYACWWHYFRESFHNFKDP